MKVAVITFCLIGAVFANPISYKVLLESNGIDANTTESFLSQLSENDTSELQSSEENTSNQSSESESLESEDSTSEESDGQSDENDQLTSMAETRDNSMGSEENVRKRLVQVFASVAEVLSAEDNSSTEVKGQPEHLSNEQTEKQLTSTSTAFKQATKTLSGHTKLQLAGSSETTSTDASDITAVTAATSDSSESISSESSESNESSNSSDDSKSTEDSNASESTELAQIKAKHSLNGTVSFPSEEQHFQTIGDDAYYYLDNDGISLHE